MATLVSHAMRRYPITPPDAEYSSHNFRGTTSRQPWSQTQESESALSRSMRYAEPWLYGSVRAPSGFVLAPALVLCSCAEYINGTKRSSKKSPSVCKKCKGTRIPISNVESSKFGTVRCYPTAQVPTSTPVRAGTVRVSSKSRPSILPSGDPYDLMRRSRLSVPENSSQFRARSVSPNKIHLNESRSSSSTRIKLNTSVGKYSTVGRKSILECNVNPYDLMSLDTEPKDASITLVNGQRIRTRQQSTDSEYENIQVRRQQTHITSNQNDRNKVKNALLKLNEKESESNRFKSILKKPTTTFSDTDLNGGPERSPSPAHNKSGSHFYLPMPPSTPRKKVQFLVENEIVAHKENEQNCENFIPEDTSENENRSKSITPNTTETKSEKESTYDKGINRGNACKLRRSRSERVSQEPVKVVFHDTMALRSRVARNDSRAIFTERELEKLDGVSTSLRLKPFDVVRPRGPPPQPPNQSVDEYNCNKSNTSEIVANNSTLETMRKIVERENDSVNILNEICSNNSENSNLPDTTNSRNESQIDLEIPLKIFGASKNTTSLNDLQKSVDLIANDYANELQQDIIPPNTKSEAIISKNIENEPQAVIIDNSNECPIINITEQKTIITDVTPLDSTNDESNIDTPSAPPRKRSNNKQPVVITTPITQMIKIDAQSEIREVQNKTIVKINSNLNSTVHKLKIKNEFQDISYNTIEVRDTSKGKTSIMINGDDCYCTVNVSDDIPLYQSSVVVKDSGIKIESNSRKSSSVYITGNFVNSAQIIKEEGISFHNKLPNKEIDVQVGKEYEESIEKIKPNHSNIETIVVDNEAQKNLKLEKLMNGNNSTIPAADNDYKDYSEQPVEICSADMLKQILNDPVEAVKRNLVPHVCGKSDVSRRPPRNKKNIKNNDLVASFLNDLNSTIDDFQVNPVSQLIEESFLKLRNHDVNVDDDKDACSEHSSSTQYELMDPGSDCYTDNSNRSSVTEEELSARSKFYELLAECAVEVSENEDHHYESIRANVDPIYEEIEIPPPLPSNPPPIGLLDDIHLDKEYTTRSIFEGASKYDILSYLVDAKERGIVPEDSYTYNFNNTGVVVEDDTKENITAYNRVSQMSTVSDSSEDSSLVIPGALIEDKVQRSIDIERNDSGVGSETSKCSLSKYRSKPELAVTCEDCEGPVDSKEDTEPLICRKCLKKRSERKEIITEIVETEEKYSRDLQIILEEFYQPMLVAGLLTSEQLSAIFLNVEELLENSQALAERLRDAVEIAAEQGDEDLLTVNIGKLILEAAPMLHAFETYCVRQGGASLLLAGLEKEKELLRIFLRVSQMENTVLRRMNLNSFLMVPVQRVTKYPLLLARLYKVTPTHHDTREQLKEAQHKIELHLNHMNSETKDIPSKLWRRISSYPGRRSSSEMDLVNIKLRKIAVDVLEWNHDEARFALEGKLLFTQPTDNNWRKGRTIKLTPVNALLVTNGKVSSSSNRPDPSDDSLIFSRHPGVREAALLLVRDKNGRYSLLREPLYLDRCVIAADPAWQSYFEVQELLGKDTFIFKADDEDQTRVWYRHLQYYAQGMGAWRKRRNALANIMINGMGLRS